MVDALTLPRTEMDVAELLGNGMFETRWEELKESYHPETAESIIDADSEVLSHAFMATGDALKREEINMLLHMAAAIRMNMRHW